MHINFSDIEEAFSDLKSVAGEAKVSMFALLKFGTDSLQVCYADTNSAYDKKIDGEPEEGDIVTDVLVDIKLFTSKLLLYKVSGHVQLKPLSIKIDGDSLSLYSKKYLIVARYKDGTEEIALDADGNPVLDEVEGSEIRTSIKYSDNIKSSLTARTPFEELYTADEWLMMDKQKFIKMVDILSKTLDCPKCCVTSKLGVAFAPGKSYIATLKPDAELMEASYSIGTSSAIKIANIFRKHSCDIIKMAVIDQTLIKIVSDTEDIAIRVNFAQVSRSDMSGLKRYTDTEFNSLKLQFNREVLLDTVRGALLVIESGNATSSLKFKYDSDNDTVKLVINKKSGGSANEDLQVIAENYVGDTSQLEDLEISVVFKIIEQMLIACQESVVEFSLSDGEAGQKVACISDIVRVPFTKEVESTGVQFYTCV